MTATTTNVTLRLLPREMRMMTERVFSLSGMPKGFFLMVQDLVMYSQRLGLGGFALLEQRSTSLKGADPSRVSIVTENNETLKLDAAGEHVWFILPTVIDLLGELAEKHGTAQVTVTNVVDPSELKIAEAFAARSGLDVRVKAGVLTAKPRAMTGDLATDEPLLWDLLDNGLVVEADLWWRVYSLAQTALAPDSVVSRRHAGPVIVNDDGSIIGRKDSDDETDLKFLITPLDAESKAAARKESVDS